MKTIPLLALTLATALPLLAQTAPAPVHHSTPATPGTAVHRTTGGCVTLPTLSPKIPSLPAGLPCAKPLYTLTRTPDVKLDYAAPFLSPEVRSTLAPSAGTYSLVYIDTKIGTGDLIKPKKWLTVHYTGYLPDGTKFDSSLDRGEPISFPYGQHRVIPGWDSGFEGMHIGGKRRLFIPYELAYGEAGHPPVIPAKSQLIFDVEFISQSDEQPKPKTPPTPPTPQAKPITTPPPPPPADKPATAPATTPPASTTTTPPPTKQ